MRSAQNIGGLSLGHLMAAGALGVVAVVAVLAQGVIGGLQIEWLATVFLAAVLIAAGMLGLTYGLLAALAAWIAYHLLTGTSVLAFDFASPGGWRLGLLVFAVLIAGAGSDVLRAQAKTLPADVEPPRRTAMRSTGWRKGGGARSVGRLAALLGELKGLLVSLCIVGVGVATAALLRPWVGESIAAFAVLACVLLSGGLSGARFGFAAGVFAVLMIDLPTAAPDPSLRLQLQAGVHLVVFAGSGWVVGRLADALQLERRRLTLMAKAAGDFAASADEAVIRQLLIGGLTGLGGEQAQIVEAGDKPVDAASLREGWRVRRLAAHDRDMGEVRWRFPRSTGAADDAAQGLVDTAAAAIVRTRLGVENAEMEFVARTEHLRTILLDAVSHHFRSPLAGIMGSVTGILNLPEQHDRAVRRDLLLIIKEQANRLNRYVDNFLSVARLESGSIDINLADLSLEPLLYDVWETFGEAGGARRFLRVQIEDVKVRADASLLAQVFGNVLENAIKFSPEGSVVDVRSRRVDGRLVIDVTDSGPGVPAASQGRIFDRFFRSQGAKAPGLGLGLYITRSLVEMLGGAVEAANRTDGEPGLIISVAIPLSETRT